MLFGTNCAGHLVFMTINLGLESSTPYIYLQATYKIDAPIHDDVLRIYV